MGWGGVLWCNASIGVCMRVRVRCAVCGERCLVCWVFGCGVFGCGAAHGRSASLWKR